MACLQSAKSSYFVFLQNEVVIHFELPYVENHLIVLKTNA